MGTVKHKQIKEKRRNRCWFDYNCRQKRREYFSAKHKAKKSKSSFDLEELKIKSKAYKSCLRIAERKRQNSWHRELRLLKSNNPREYWKKIQRKKHTSVPVALQNIYEHFKSLNESEIEKEGTNSDGNIFTQNIIQNLSFDYDMESLNSAITEDEIISAVKKLKSGKAAGEDLIYNEYIKKQYSTAI